MRGFLAVFANFSIFTEAASQAYSLALCLSTSKQRFLRFIKRAEDPAGRGEVSIEFRDLHERADDILQKYPARGGTT
jgi:hypothetical protein